MATTTTESWKTVFEIASKHGMLPSEVERIAIQTGVASSRQHARDSRRGREYSPAAVLLIEREIRARAKQVERLLRAAG